MKSSSNDAESYYRRGVSRLGMRLYDEAISDFTKALEIRPRYADAYKGRGVAYSGEGQYDQAISDFTSALEINPRDAEVYLRRMVGYFEKGQDNQALSDYRKALEIDPNLANALDSQAILWALKGVNPNLGELYHGRGIAYFFKGEYQESWEDVEKAQSLGYQIHPEFLDELRKASGRKP